MRSRSLLTAAQAAPRAAALSLLVLGNIASPSAHAQIRTFELTYSGAAFGNAATGAGTITLEMSAISNPGDNTQVQNFVTGFSLTITGANTGNGTFGFADYNGGGFGGFVLSTNRGTLDFSRELVGQPTADLPFGTTPTFGVAGDFNIFSNGSNPAAPEGTLHFQITTNGGSGSSLYLTSFRPVALAVALAPEPTTCALFATAGLLPVVGAVVKKRRSK